VLAEIRMRITSRDWVSYPILRFEDVFSSVDVYVIDRPSQPYLGIGEGGQGPTAAAITNFRERHRRSHSGASAVTRACSEGPVRIIT
jgi:hypothetical protein